MYAKLYTVTQIKKRITVYIVSGAHYVLLIVLTLSRCTAATHIFNIHDCMYCELVTDVIKLCVHMCTTITCGQSTNLIPMHLLVMTPRVRVYIYTAHLITNFVVNFDSANLIIIPKTKLKFFICHPNHTKKPIYM